jgi:hypothetical protein
MRRSALSTQSLLVAKESNSQSHAQLWWSKPILVALGMVGAIVIGRIILPVSTVHSLVIPAATGQSGVAQRAQVPAALQGVVAEKGLMGHDAPTLGAMTGATALNAAGREARSPVGSAAAPPFTLDDLLGPEGSDSRPSEAKGAAGQPYVLHGEANSVSRRHAPEPPSIIPSGTDDGSVGAALRQGINQTFDEAIDLLSDYRLSKSIRLRARDCGESRSVSYDPATRMVLLCHQFVMHMYAEALRHGTADPAEYARDVARFAVAHEIGHALVDIYKLPVLGREEDAADQFATFLFLQHRRPIPVLAAAQSFGAGDPFAGLDLAALWDEHSLDQQRIANLTCWLVGDAPEENALIADNLPASRRARCPSEFAQLRTSWSRLLRPHLRD